MDLGIEGKVALVTGGGRGLGKHCAISLAREGVNVAICGRTQETLDRTRSELNAFGVKALGVVADVSDSSTIPSLHQQVVDAVGEVDILINNVGGIVSSEGIIGTSPEDFRATFDINLFGGFELIKLTIPHMREQQWGRIINIASIGGREYGGNISYMSAKAALIGATKHAARELAKDGVLVNSLAPGIIAHEGGNWGRFQRDNPPEVVASFIEENLPMGRFGWPEPVGDTVAFLCSDRAGMITGACIVIDGGQSYSMI